MSIVASGVSPATASGPTLTDDEHPAASSATAMAHEAHATRLLRQLRPFCLTSLSLHSISRGVCGRTGNAMRQSHRFVDNRAPARDGLFLAGYARQRIWTRAHRRRAGYAKTV